MKRASPSSPAERGGTVSKKPRGVIAPGVNAAGRPVHPTSLAVNPGQPSATGGESQYIQGDYSNQGYDASGYGTYDYSYYDGNYDMTYSTVGYYGQGVYDSMYGQTGAQSSTQSQPVSSYYGSMGANSGNKNPMYGSNAQATSGYGVFGASNVAASAAGACRTVWIGNLPLGVTVEQLLDHVHFGALESVKIVPEKSCAFITFLNANDAASFHQHCQVNRFHIQNIDLNVRWGKSSAGSSTALPPNIQLAIANGASRNVYISGVPQGTVEMEIRADLEQFGELDNVRIVPPRDGHKAAICFVHFCSIASAMKCVTSLAQMNPKYVGRRISYGKDRCARRPNQGQGTYPQAQSMYGQQQMQRSQPNYGQLSSMQGSQLNAGPGGMQGQTPHQPTSGQYPGMSYDYQPGYNVNAHDPAFGLDPTLFQTNNLRYMPADYHAKVNPGNIRTIYLGSLPDDCIPEDICNVLRAGLIEKISILLPEKACAFITFMDARAASLIYYFAESRGIVIRGRRVKCGWGKPTRPLSSQLMYAVTLGASRNVYVGQLPSWLFATGDSGDTSTANPLDVNDPNAAQAQAKAKQIQQQQMAAAELLTDFAIYGEVEVIHVLAEKQVAFINFMDIRNAMKAVEEAPNALRQKYGNCRVSYGKDRCSSDVRLPREAGMSIGGMIPRRMTGSFAPGAGSSNATNAGYTSQVHHNGTTNVSGFGRSLDLPTRPSIDHSEVEGSAANPNDASNQMSVDGTTMNHSMTPVLLELTPEPEDQGI